MPRIRFIKILNILIEICYLAIVFFVPVYFALFLKNANVFELNKIVLFKVLVLLLLLLTLIKIIIRRNRACPVPATLCVPAINKKYLLIPALFLLSLILSAVFSVNPEQSYYGLYDRRQGLDSQLFYFLFFVLLLLNVKTSRQINRITAAIACSSFIACLYGLVQAGGLDPLDWIESTSYRITSTLGQPNFFASYLLLAIPAAAYLIVKSKKALVRFCWAIVLICQLLCLYFTYSRAGWLGFVFGLAAAGAVYLYFNKSRLRGALKLKYTKLIAPPLIFIFLTGSLLVLLNDNAFSQRVKSGFDITGGSASARMNFWQAGIDAVKQRPIFGYGPENQGEVFVKYYEKDWAESGRVNVYPNRAHNLFLDVVLTSGFIGLVFYLALLYLFFKLIIDNIKNSKSKFLSWFILFAVISYLISLMFGFAVVATDIYFWLYFAIIIIINSGQEIKISEEEGEDVLCHQKNIYCPPIKLLKFVLIIIISAGIFFQISKEFKKLIADHYFRELQLSYARQEYFKAFTLYGYIKQANIKTDYYDRNFGIMLADKIDNFDTIVLIRTGEKTLESIAENLSGNSYADIFARAKIYSALASEEKYDYYNLAKENFSQAIGLSPEMPKNYRELANMHVKKGNYETAISNYQKALTMAPDVSGLMSKMHKECVEYEKYLIYNSLGEAYFKKELYKEAEYYYWLAYGNNMPDITIFRKIADTYYSRGDLNQAVWYNKRGSMLNPKDYNWLLSIALLHQEQGDMDNALRYAEKALELAPENEQVKKLINDLQDNL
ncbi:O-antigen ligase family protein [Patescibacteria group bacterium]|nr:O-antigen ligase family protein [Patescibacteria group bacterium]MBU4600594.1 O-antigen ligase family protein [Patescibacteria group bacterium]MCG2698034.1 O-antigen ligase family protein [Candidatus Parcubacteria bacterium]